jgi:outer membrane protein assembly factor BamD
MFGGGWLSILILSISISCSNFRKIEKSDDWRVKYEAGLNYYAKKDYYRSSVLFEQILPIVRGLPEGEKVEFNLAYCQYNEKLYLACFRSVQRHSLKPMEEVPWLQEAYFMYAYSLYASSPDYKRGSKQ